MAHRYVLSAGCTSLTVEDIRCIKADLLTRGHLFEDPDFPAMMERIGPVKKASCKWKRPMEIHGAPKFIAQNGGRFDVKQGSLDDFWLLSVLASLSLYPDLFNNVVPRDQDFNSGNYCGLFYFRFWQCGEWVHVIVDDRLPLLSDSSQLVLMHSSEQDQFWVALLEKAYAKLLGSYDALNNGLFSEAIEDFTGGITVSLAPRMSKSPTSLFYTMLEADRRRCLMSCAILGADKPEKSKSCGLHTGREYLVTDLKAVKMNTEVAKDLNMMLVTGGAKVIDRVTSPGNTVSVHLVRLRDPYGGTSGVWTGAWGRKSRDWKLLSAGERARLGVTSAREDEFWMSIADFCASFTRLDMCHLSDAARWDTASRRGTWRRRVSAGGCTNYMSSYAANPQFHVKVIDSKNASGDNRVPVIVGLMQINPKRCRAVGFELLSIGYQIYQKPNSNRALNTKFFWNNENVDHAGYVKRRQVCCRHELAPGDYVIVPTTFHPDGETEFLLRVYAEGPVSCEELDEVTAMVDLPKPVMESSATEQGQELALRHAFDKVSGSDQEVDAYELRDILNMAFMREFNFAGFSLETSRSMVAMMDTDQSGRLGFDEFKALWSSLRIWKTAFKRFDGEKLGSFSSYELRQALSTVGFRVSNRIYKCLVMRYSDRAGTVEFNDFIVCCVRLKTIFETFRAKGKADGGVYAAFSKDEYLRSAAYV